MKLQYCVNRTGAVPPEKLALTGLEVQKAARAFHSTIPGYEPTPLTALDHLARRLGVSQVLVKDESKRFGLNAFKALGGSYAMARYLGEQLGLGRDQLTFEALGTPEAREKLGLTDDRPLLLSYWGSLGAEVMNRRMVDFLEREAKEGAPFRHIHGAGRDFAWMQEELLRRGVKLEGTGIEVREYIYDMPLVMAAADVVVCRAGASTISELTAIAKPSILVPSPNVTANHQEKNARVLSGQGAAVLLLEKDCPGMELYDQASALLRDPARRDSMIRALNSMAVPDAGEKIYQTLAGLLKK